MVVVVGGDIGGVRGRLYIYHYTVTTRMTCIRMGSDESHSVNVSLIVRDKVTRQCPQTTGKRYASSVFIPCRNLPDNTENGIQYTVHELCVAADSEAPMVTMKRE